MSEVLDEALAEFDGEQSAEAPEAVTAEPEETPQPEAEGEPAVEPEEPELILGRFKSHDDLANAYQELEREFGSRNEQWRELKELREQFQGFQQTQQTQAVASNAVGLIQSAVEEGDFRRAASIASQVPDQGVLAGQVLDLWKQADPDGAEVFETRQMLASQQQMFTNVMSQVNMQAAYTQFVAENPDAQQLGGEMLQVAQQSPNVVAALLQSDDPAAHREALDFLYTKAKVRASAGLSAGEQQSAAEAQAAKQAAVKQAYVGSTATVPQPQTTPAGQQWLDSLGFDQELGHYLG